MSRCSSFPQNCFFFFFLVVVLSKSEKILKNVSLHSDCLVRHDAPVCSVVHGEQLRGASAKGCREGHCDLKVAVAG